MVSLEYKPYTTVLLVVMMLMIKSEAKSNYDKYLKYSAAFGNTKNISTVYDGDFTSLYRVNVTNPNQSIMLPCGAGKVHAMVRGNVTWMKNDQRILTTLDKEKSSLVVRNLNHGDSGTYSCRICELKRCHKSSSVKLEISYGTPNRNQTVLEGSDAKFDCFLSFAFDDTKFEIFFLKSKVVDDIMEAGKPSYNHMQLINNVRKQDAGWYTCIVRDPVTGTIIYKQVTYLEVLAINQEKTGKSSMFVIISIVLILLIAMMILLSIMWFRKEPKREYDEHKIKLVTVCKKSSFRVSKGFHKPIVRVRRQTIMVLRNKKNPAKLFKYKFPFDSEWEFPRENIILGKMLGKGVFGKVFAATASGLVEEGATSVAVKMLNAEHSDEDVEDLVHELEVMKMVGSHTNIVNLLGCCSKDGPLYVIVDYAAHGNLQSFLRKHRFESDIDQDNKLLICQNQLHSFVAQIASGMEHLASIDCFHKDLRARNVLVCEDYIMKITDYGRDVYNIDRFPKTTSGKVPIQWMAPESLQEYIFDEKSDVWSFGVTFWEVMTLGEEPFPEFDECEKLVEVLKQGKQLEQLKNCPDGVYTIMRNCWQFKPVFRPTFSEIVQQLKQLPYTLLLDGYSEAHDTIQNNRETYATVHNGVVSHDC